jgi:tetratricopeptide (TPR) repeat protein
MQPPPGSINAHLEAAQGYLGLGMALEAFNELEEIAAAKRAHPRVLKVRFEVCRALEQWELGAEIARHLAGLEPDDPLHRANLAQCVRHLEGPAAAAEILEAAVERCPEVGSLRLGLAVELCAAGRVDEGKAALREAIKIDPQLRAVALDHPGLEAVW